MSKLELIATATFGLEAVVKREIESLGYRILKSEDAKITYMADERGIVRSNLWLRCADRVLLKMGEFSAETSEELFQRTKGISWEDWIPEDGKFTVNCTTVKSKLRSEPVCQKTVKKAIADRLCGFYMRNRMPETGPAYTVKLTLLNDSATLTIDTSGSGLHNRGYRLRTAAAPIKETLAAALVQLSFWKSGRLLMDPFCGSGTIPIEAAMCERNMAPGLLRSFVSEEWYQLPGKLWKEEREAAKSAVNPGREIKIRASDIDRRMVAAAGENAERAGVSSFIDFAAADFKKAEPPEDKYSVIICNPPYGERIGDEKDLKRLYSRMSYLLGSDSTLSAYIITADKTIEKAFMPRKPDRKRKLYNGRIETCYFQYYGERPPQAKSTV